MNGKEFLNSKWIDEAKKPDAKINVQQKFNQWSNRVKNTGILNKAKELWSYIISGQVSGTEKVEVLAALLYIISPIDLIPDFIPVAGWLDDMGVAAFALSLIMNKISNIDLNAPIAGTNETVPVSDSPVKDFQYKNGLSYEIEDLKDVAYELDATEWIAYAEDIEEKLDSSFFSVMFVGRYSSGKSTLINAFLGKKLLPVSAIATRRPITYIMMGSEEKLYSESRQGEITIHENVSELLDKENKCLEEANRISLFLPSKFLSDQLCFIDTPGLEDPNQDFSNMTLQAAPTADALVMVIHIGYTQSAADWAFLKDMLRDDRDRKVFVVLNHADTINNEQINNVIETISKSLNDLNIPKTRIFALSAKNACERIFAGETPDRRFNDFKTALLGFLNKSRKFERERIIRQQVNVLSNKLKDTCATYVDLQEKTLAEKKSILEQLANKRKQAEKLIDNEERKIERKVLELENRFLSNFESFCNDLRREVQRHVDRATLDQLRADYGLSNNIKIKIREFIEKHLRDIHAELGDFTYGCISKLHNELQKTNFPIEIERDESVIIKNPDLIIVGGLFIAWPILGIMSFAALAAGALFGRSYIESMIKNILEKQGKEKARRAILAQLDEQLTSFKKDFTIHIHEHFNQLRNDCIAKIKSSMLENIGTAYTVAHKDIADVDMIAQKARKLLPRFEKQYKY
ncbi:MAG: Bacterial dynamin-like protein [Deltaproteobacteria bacterium ADurb.Bin135]|nr:MAG: Bacterial dynamin-like protein [Deltaproteobacteria bacterium ADurb.Bin135]HOS45796.1 dynamin family protein [Paludibacter sp.]